jgi:hypothetical protein
MHKPCLLIDEGDTFVELSEELRGILNSGHRHDGAVLRVVGEDLEPRLFATFSPCSVALIGELPPTLADRSILVGLKRRRPADGDVTSFSLDEVGHLDLLARQSARWAQDHAVDIAATKPEMPDGIINRARDNWRVLKAIATVAGGEWPSHIDDAALAWRDGPSSRPQKDLPGGADAPPGFKNYLGWLSAPCKGGFFAESRPGRTGRRTG